MKAIVNLQKTIGPYRVISADENTVTTDRDELRDTVSIDLFTRTPPQIAAQATENPT